MRKRLTPALAVLSIALAGCGYAFALDPALDINQYAHTSWKVRDGFTKGAITSLAQTSDGYLWLGTELGLVRFDGVRAVPWQPPAGAQLPSNHIASLLVAKDGTLWIGMWRGLASWNGKKLTTYPEMAGQAVGRMLEGRDGTIWAGGGGTPHPGRLCAIRAGNIQCRGDEGTLGTVVGGLYEDAKGTLWVGVLNGFWRWAPGASEFFGVPKELMMVTDFAEDESGSLLVATRSGLSRLINGKVERYHLPGFDEVFFPTKILRDRDGGVWIATLDRGLIHAHQGKTDVFSTAEGLAGDFTNAVLEDREGNIWTASAAGLDRFREYSVASFSVKQGLSHNNAISVLATRDGSVWISTINGLNRWTAGHVSLVSRAGRTAKTDRRANVKSTASLFEDRSGKVWVSSAREFGYFENEKFVAVAGVPNGFVYDIVEAGREALWLTNQQAGLIHLSEGKMVQQIPWAGLGHTDYALRLTADPSGKGLWLGFADGGVAYFADGGIKESFSAAQGLGQGQVAGLRFGPRGALWAATQSGLSRIKDGHINTLTTKNGLPCDVVHWSIEDDDHSMWIYTACGLVRVSRADMDTWIADPTKMVKATVFDGSDGVPTSPLAGAFAQAVTKSLDGKFWFVTQDGVGIIDPHHLALNKVPPPVHIEQVTADDKPFDTTNEMRLPARVRNLQIDYTALSLVVPEKVRFRVMLEGQDTDWRELANVRRVEYTNLAPKHYRFRVLACNNSGVWNEQGAGLEFIIPPAWYETTVFRALCVAALLTLVWAVYRFRVRQLAYQFNMRLEERVSERTRIARDLHDTLLQSFQAVLPRLQTAIYKLPEGAADARKTLEEAVDLAADAVTEGRDAVQGLRMSTVEKNELAAAIRTVGEELASAEGSAPAPKFEVVVEGASRNLHPILRDEIYRLATEALRNAFKHAAAQSVRVEIRYGDKCFCIRIRDDGKGIRDDVLRGAGRKGHYGLHGMKERAENVGGKLTIWSEVDNGTEVELTIPASRAYEKGMRRFRYFAKRSTTSS